MFEIRQFLSLFDVAGKTWARLKLLAVLFLKEPAIPGHVHNQSRSWDKGKLHMGLFMPKRSGQLKGGSHPPARGLVDRGINQVSEGTNDGFLRLIFLDAYQPSHSVLLEINFGSREDFRSRHAQKHPNSIF